MAGEWVIFGWAEGERGKVRIAITAGEEEPDSAKMQKARVTVTAMYRQMYYAGMDGVKGAGADDWPTPRVMKRDESSIERKTFSAVGGNR